jgi:hypothetical protein
MSGHPRHERPWRNIELAPLPEPHPDRFQMRPNIEIALGPTPQRPPSPPTDLWQASPEKAS